MFARHIRTQLILRARILHSVFRNRILQIEATRASSNKSEKPPDPIPIYTDDFPARTEQPIAESSPVYTQGYPSMKRVEPYSRELCQHLPKQTYVPNTPQYQTAFHQNQVGYPQLSQYSCLEHCCCGLCSGGNKPPPCCPQQPCTPPRPTTPQEPCNPPQPCYPCWSRHPCCCTRCGPCSTKGNWCIPQMDCCGRRIVPPPECRPGPVPPNPCCPQYPKDRMKFFRSIFLFLCIPLIILQMLNVMNHEPCPKIPCREFEYMRRRTKRFPWGDGVKSFFHNDEVNHLPGDCEPPPLICET